MKRIFAFLILAFISLNCYAIDPGSWDLLDEDCSDISDWTDADTGTGVSEVDPAGQFRLDTNGTLASRARRTRDIGEYPNQFTIELKLYHDDIGDYTATDDLRWTFAQADESFSPYFGSNGLFIRDTDDGYQEVGTDLVLEGGAAEWQTWRFLVTFTGTTGDGTCDVYLKDTTNTSGAWALQASGVTCSLEQVLDDGYTRFQQRGSTTTDMVSHVDWIKIATGHYDPTAAASQVIIIPMI